MKHSPAFLRLVDGAKKNIRELSVDNVAQKFERDNPFVLLDIREESEWAKGHIKGATYIGKGILERDIESKVPDKTADLVLYCGGGFRSALAAEALQKMGYQHVSSMDGGWREWTTKGLPTEK